LTYKALLAHMYCCVVFYRGKRNRQINNAGLLAVRHYWFELSFLHVLVVLVEVVVIEHVIIICKVVIVM